ncbi:MAG TPA: ATP-binding cassette domain-containing protein [Acholeplasmataceae bacterium]|jgi:ABC-2 type transport system ATP-binding protein|nr:ATP-binding cassette domain-containing protein [Acholeplasmataceae bacterium]
MILFVLIPSIILIAIYLVFLKKRGWEEGILKILGVILFFSYLLQLRTNLAIDRTIALEGGPLKPFMTILVVIIRWFSGVVALVGITAPFFKSNKSFTNIMRFITPFVLFLNLIFFDANNLAFFGERSIYYTEFKFYMIVLGLICLAIQSGIYLIQMVRQRNLPTKREVGMMFLVFVLLLPTMMPQASLRIFFGKLGSVTNDFTLIHRLTIYFSFLIMPIVYIYLKNQTRDSKRLFFIVLAISSVFQFLYIRREGLAGLPFHLCNTALFLMLISFVFDIKSTFYFSYFVNVLGALCAIILPNISADAFTLSSVGFWYNHIYAFILPILAVAVGVYPRPHFKMMRGAIMIFTIYFVSMMFVNAWFNNYTLVDYFFLYSDFLTEKFPFAVDIKINYVLYFTGNNLVFKFFWLYDLLIYVAFIALMFLAWAVYDFLFRVADAHGALRIKLKKDKMDILSLRKEMQGRPLTEPLNLEGENMIKIENFTKVYGNSKKPAVDNFSLEVYDGEVFGFIGHNGAGKSTTIKSLVGIQSITSGRMEIAGYDVSKQPIEAKLRIGYVSDNHAVYERLTGREYINYVADLYLVPQEERDQRIEKYVHMFSLEHAIDNEIKSYSHGMKQKIVVIASLIHNPKVWILDEPLTGLDPMSSFQIKECMREHANNGNIVFFSSHVIEVVEKICDRIAIISNGKLQGVYELNKLREQGLSLEELYMLHATKESENERHS